MDAERAGTFVLPVFAIPVENLRELNKLFFSAACLVCSLTCTKGKRLCRR